MRKDALTIWVALGISRRIRTFTLYHNVIKLSLLALLIATIAGLSLFITFTKKYKAMKEKVVALEVLKAENKKQQEKIDYFTQNLSDLANQVNRLEAFSKKLQEMASMEPFKGKIKLQSNDKNYGWGGPIEDKEELWAESSLMRSWLKENSADIEELRARVIIQEKTFKELEKILNRKKDIFLSTPSIWPVKGRVASGFGKRSNPFTGKIEIHKGIDILARYGTPIKASANGVVVDVGSLPGLGNFVKINHGNGIVTRYGHTKKNVVRKGQRVKKGQTIAYVGTTGLTTGPHLHYEVIVKGRYRNPLRFILD
jgi:murein DD-endopeptidase MepM/ murein hydrolase activator NlpD